MPYTEKKIMPNVDADLEELIPTYLKNRQEDIILIKEALNKEDYESIKIIGHKMKGSGGGYGFDDISAIGAKLETASIKKDMEEINKSANSLVDYLKNIEIVYI